MENGKPLLEIWRPEENKSAASAGEKEAQCISAGMRLKGGLAMQKAENVA